MNYADDSGSFNSLLRTSMAVACWLLSCKHGDTSLLIGGDRWVMSGTTKFGSNLVLKPKGNNILKLLSFEA